MLLLIFTFALSGAVSRTVQAQSHAPIVFEAVRATKTIQAVRISEPLDLDGRLDEPAWDGAVAGVDFYQQEPDDGAPATEPSEVRVLYDAEALYVGGTFFDSSPRGPIVGELKRDFTPRDGDMIAVILRTFNDTSSYNFQINAAGAQRDAQVFEDGRQINVNWDGIWSVKTARFEGGWTMEMAIPFKTLRFEDVSEQDWGLNVFRFVRRLNESSYWSPQPLQFRIFKASLTGRLTGIRNVRPGRNLQIKPFYTGALSNATLPSLNRRWDGNGGADLKYSVSTSLALDLTYRTDFSQVEADEQQINLTRFSLFFPEKRDFFLENQGAFRIGDQNPSGGGAAERRDLLPFFSRRIGLASSGQPIPIVGGARLTGRQGANTLGLLNIQTEAFDGRPGDNFSVLRAARNFGASSIGGVYLGREAVDSHDRLAGGDVHLSFHRTVDVNALVLRSASDGGQRGAAGRAAVNLVNNHYSALVAYTNISPGFRNDLGFVPRTDIGLISWDAARYFRWTRPTSRLREVAVGTLGERFENSGHDDLNSRHVRAYVSQNFADSGGLDTNVDWNYERLTEPFQVSRGVFIAPGEYRFAQFQPTYQSSRGRAISFTSGASIGEFYSGTIRGLSGSLRWRLNANVAASGSVDANNVGLLERFNTTVSRFRLDYSFSTTMFLNAFVQHNSATGTWTTNVRYRFMYRPLSDFYLVYNELRSGAVTEHTVAVKHTMMIAF